MNRPPRTIRPAPRPLAAIASALAMLAIGAPAASANPVSLAGDQRVVDLSALGSETVWAAATDRNEPPRRVVLRRLVANQAPDVGGVPAARAIRGLQVAPDEQGRPTASYLRCTRTTCRWYRVPLAAGGEQRIRNLGASGCQVTALAHWRGSYAFVRTGTVNQQTGAQTCSSPGLFVRFHGDRVRRVPVSFNAAVPGAVQSIDLRGRALAIARQGYRGTLIVEELRLRTNARVSSRFGVFRSDLPRSGGTARAPQVRLTGSRAWFSYQRAAAGSPVEQRILRARRGRGGDCQSVNRAARGTDRLALGVLDRERLRVGVAITGAADPQAGFVSDGVFALRDRWATANSPAAGARSSGTYGAHCIER